MITNIGMAHAEFFGSRDEVARAKGELLEALPADGAAVLCADDDMTPGLRARTGAAVLTAGTGPRADLRVSGVRLDDDLRPSFRLDTPWGAIDVPPLPVRGAHQAGNAALAVAVAGADRRAARGGRAGLAGAVGSPLADGPAPEPRRTGGPQRRLQRQPHVDGRRRRRPGGPRRRAAGASPSSGRWPSWACIPPAEHQRLGALVAKAERGAARRRRRAAELAEGARAAGAETIEVETPDMALAAVARRLLAGDAVLVKASRVVGLEAGGGGTARRGGRSR